MVQHPVVVMVAEIQTRGLERFCFFFTDFVREREVDGFVNILGGRVTYILADWFEGRVDHRRGQNFSFRLMLELNSRRLKLNNIV